MSDILDDLKMMADHCDQENGDEPCDLGMLLIRAIAEIRKQREKQPVSAAEVPMPEPDATLHDDGYFVAKYQLRTSYDFGRAGWRLDVISMAKARTYGDAREAAGYARAANWLRTSAKKHAEENGYHEPDTGSFVFAGRAAEEWNNSVLELADEMGAALRGEVKP